MKRYVWCEPVRHRLLGMVLGLVAPSLSGQELKLASISAAPSPLSRARVKKKHLKIVLQILLEPFLTCDLGMGALKIAKSSTGSPTL